MEVPPDDRCVLSGSIFFKYILYRGNEMTEAEQNELNAAYKRIEQLYKEIYYLTAKLKELTK